MYKRQILNNDINNTRTGIRIDPGAAIDVNCSIKSNTITQATQQGILIEDANRVDIEMNKILRADRNDTGTYAGIELINSDVIRVVNNVSDSQSLAAYATYGLEIDSTCDGVYIDGNDFSRNSVGSFLIDASATGIEFTPSNQLFAGEESTALLIYEEQQANGATSGSFATGARRTRQLNNETKLTTVGALYMSTDLPNYQFTLKPGKYMVRAWASGYTVNKNKTAIANITDGTDAILGQDSIAIHYATNKLDGFIEITATKVFELQHECQTTANPGFGFPAGFGEVCVYSHVDVERIQ